jgi:hypothetical protein
MRSFRATHNQIAVSANNRETAINTPQTLDTSLLVDAGDVIGIETRNETNADEMTGHEEPDTVYSLGQTSTSNFTFNKAQPGHIAFLAAYGLGQCANAASGAGYIHTITPIEGDVDAARSVPTFTSGDRLGKTIAKRRHTSMAVDQLTLTMAEDSWVKAVGAIKGTGKTEVTVVEEEVSAPGNSTTLTLAANGVHGATTGERLDNVQQIRVELTPGVWTEVAYSAVSSATPAEITIAAPDVGTDPVTYKVLYAPVEPVWASFPARVTESPLRVSEMDFRIGGAWNGTAFSGGRQLTSDIKSVEWTLNNGLEVKFKPGQSGAYAGAIFRPARTQTLKLSREMRDWMLQNMMATGEHMAARIVLNGAEFAPGESYKVEIIFPKLAVLSDPISVDTKRLAEAGDLSVLQHDTYGSVIVKVTNQVPAYAA